jgi:type IV secretion system protein TrbF
MLNYLVNPLALFRNLLGGRRTVVVQAPPSADTAAPIAEVVKQTALNPYLEARREWNERYGDYIRQAHNWRAMAIINSAVALVCVIGIAYISAQSKVAPYVVEVDKLGEVAALGGASRAPGVDARVMKAYLARFVTDWRTVTVDRQEQKSAIGRVYAMLPSNSLAVGKLNDYFRTHNPFVLATQESVTVTVTNLLPISARTWQAEWQEVTRDERGAVRSTVRMKVSILVGITPPTEESQILINPLGVYITDLNWAQQL